MPHFRDRTEPGYGSESYLTKAEKEELAAFIELLYWRNGVVPTAADLRQQIPNCKVTDEQFDSLIKNPRIREYLTKERGVPLEAQAKLTAKQLDWIRAVTDPTDIRPVGKKLNELGLTRSQVQAWNANPYYAQVLYEQSNKSFKDGRFAVLRALQLEAMGGSTSAIKMYLELTGDYTQAPNTVVVATEARAIINNVVGILQRHVPPEILLTVVEELEATTIPRLPVSGASPLAALPMAPSATAPPRVSIAPLPKTGAFNERENYINGRRPGSSQVIDIPSEGEWH